MKLSLFAAIFLLTRFVNCGSMPAQATSLQFPVERTDTLEVDSPEPGYIAEEGSDIAHRFLLPSGYVRTNVATNSFAAYLRTLPLKPHGSEVLFFDGRSKTNYGGYIAVVDMPIGHRDLQQCADAVMRLRAEHLYAQQQYQAIHFNFSNGFRASYAKWRAGNRIRVSGNTVTWRSTQAESTSYSSFLKYLDMVYSYAGTASLAQELQAVDLADIQIGDVFIQGGYPGHAQIVVDMAVQSESGEKIFLLAQSFMPAQEIHVLTNLQGQNLGPWYKSGFEDELSTPSWTFYKHNLKRFSD